MHIYARDSMGDIRISHKMLHGLFILFTILYPIPSIKVGTCVLNNHYSNFYILFSYLFSTNCKKITEKITLFKLHNLFIKTKMPPKNQFCDCCKKEKFSTFRNVTEDAKNKADKGGFFVNVGDSLCSNCYNTMVQYDRNKKYNKKEDKSFKRHKSTENITTDYNDSFISASIEELQDEITELKKEIESLTMYSINEMTGKDLK